MAHAAVVDTADLVLAREWLAGGHVEQAQAEIERCLEHGVAPVTARFFYGLCQLRQNEIAAALAAFAEVVRDRPRDHIAHFYAGLCHERLGSTDQARECYRTALELDPGQPGFGPFLAAGWTMLPRAADDPSASEAEPTAEAAPSSDAPLGLSIAGRCLLSAHRRVRSFPLHLLATILAACASAATLMLALDNVALLGPCVLCLASGVLLAATLTLRAVSTQYEIFERRIDIRRGIFARTLSTLWVHRVEAAWTSRSSLEAWFGGSTLHLRAGGPGIPLAWPRHFCLRGIGDQAFVSRLCDEMRAAALSEQRELRWWGDAPR